VSKQGVTEMLSIQFFLKISEVLSVDLLKGQVGVKLNPSAAGSGIDLTM